MSELAVSRGSGFADVPVMIGRCLRLSRRNVDAMITALALPVLLMLVFVYLFGGAINSGTADYVTYVVPGVLLLCAAFGSATTAVTVTDDMSSGIIDRFRSMNIGGAAVLAGHVTASVVRNLVSTVLVFGVASLIGFRAQADPLAWLGALGMVLLFVLAISWVAAAIGVLARSPEAANGFSFVMMFVPYASSAFVPVNTMPSWLQGFAEHQPVTPVIETIRGLLLDQPVGNSPWQALLWFTGIALAGIGACAILFRRRAA